MNRDEQTKIMNSLYIEMCHSDNYQSIALNSFNKMALVQLLI